MTRNELLKLPSDTNCQITISMCKVMKSIGCGLSALSSYSHAGSDLNEKKNLTLNKIYCIYSFELKLILSQ